MWENTLPRRRIIYELKLYVKLSLKGESPEEESTGGVQLGWWQGGDGRGDPGGRPGVSQHCPPSRNLLSCRTGHYF